MYKDGKDWKEQVQLYTNSIYKKQPTEKKLASYIELYTKRDRDLHGSLKLMYDSFQGIIYKNDSQFVEEHLFKMVDKENPRIIFEITEL
jgi:Holliday junction resolvase RusA-like endonuclease